VQVREFESRKHSTFSSDEDSILLNAAARHRSGISLCWPTHKPWVNIVQSAEMNTDLIHGGYSTLPVHAGPILFPEWALTI
jgi:hypothetical protein